MQGAGDPGGVKAAVREVAMLLALSLINGSLPRNQDVLICLQVMLVIWSCNCLHMQLWNHANPAACSLAISVCILASLSFTSCSSFLALVSRICGRAVHISTHQQTIGHLGTPGMLCEVLLMLL